MLSTTATSRLLTALRVLPATMLLAGALSFAPGAGATGCHVAPTNLSINGGVSRNTTTVTACMSKSLVTIEEDELLSEAMGLMKKQGIRHLPVTADGTIIGVLSVADLLRALTD